MRFLLDAPLLVEALRPEPDTVALDWFSFHAGSGFVLAAPTLLRLHAGVAAAPAGAQRNALTRWLLSIEAEFDDLVLGFDAAASRSCARLLARGHAAGAPVPLAEAMVAAIAEVNGLILATRPSPGLTLWGGPVMDPWA